jgi:antitoxin component YwqK of YwqJK toxin-antitoxin module
MTPRSVLLVALAAASCSEEPAKAPNPPVAGTTEPKGPLSDPDYDPLPPAVFKARIDTPENPKPGEQVSVKEFHANGVLATERSEIALEGGKRVRVGPMKAYWENAAIRIEGGYDDEGKKHGRWKYWDEHGQLQREGDYDHDLMAGEWIDFYPDGQKRSQGLRIFGLSEGPWTYWHPNGKTLAQGDYVANQREGAWQFFDEKGGPDPIRTGTYKNGAKVQ